MTKQHPLVKPRPGSYGDELEIHAALPAPSCRSDSLAWLCHVRQQVIMSGVDARTSCTEAARARTYRCMHVRMHWGVEKATVEA